MNSMEHVLKYPYRRMSFNLVNNDRNISTYRLKELTKFRSPKPDPEFDPGLVILGPKLLTKTYCANWTIIY